MFALIQDSQIVALANVIPQGSALDYRPVVNGTKPAATTAYSTIIERPFAEWTVGVSQVERTWTEYIPSPSDQVAIQAARDVLPVLPKRKQVMEILRDALASETEPDFTPAGVSTSAIALPSHITGSSGLTQAQVDARVVFGITGKSDTAHTHAIANVTGLQTALDGKQASGSYAAAIHTHAQADVTNLVSDLASKAASGHNHDGVYSLAAHAHAGLYQPLVTVLTNTTASFTTAQETKLSGIAAAATANSADATLLARGSHTGTQTAATISDFSAAADARVAAAAGVAQFPTPTTGQTQTFNTARKSEIIACNHTATIAAQTFAFPTDANSAIAQELRIFSRNIITTVTLTLNSNTILGLALTTLPLNGNVAWRKVGASTWVRIQ